MTKKLLYKNRYMQRSRLSERKFREILKAFCIDITAKGTMDLTGISRYTINKLFSRVRYQRILLLKHRDESIPASKELFGQEWARLKKGTRTKKERLPVFGVSR
jgi:transposase